MTETPEKKLKGLIVGYLRSKAITYNRIALVKLQEKSIRAGSRVILVDKHGNRYTGKVIGVHGSKGDIVKVRFKPGIPGQAINSIVVIE